MRCIPRPLTWRTWQMEQRRANHCWQSGRAQLSAEKKVNQWLQRNFASRDAANSAGAFQILGQPLGLTLVVNRKQGWISIQFLGISSFQSRGCWTFEELQILSTNIVGSDRLLSDDDVVRPGQDHAHVDLRQHQVCLLKISKGLLQYITLY